MKRFAALAAALMLTACIARAETLGFLAREAQTPLTATVAGEYRTVDIALTARVPDVPAMGVYMAEAARVEEQSEGEALYVAPPEKRRGIAYRRREEEVFAPETLPEDYRAYGCPLTAREALARFDVLLEPYLEALPGVAAPWAVLSGRSPLCLYDKEAGTWGEQVDARETGGYRVEYAPALCGAPLLGGEAPFARDLDAYFAEGANMDFDLAAFCKADVSATAEGEPWLSLRARLPRVTETLAESVDFAPLADVFEAVKALAAEGYLWRADSLEMVYYGFVYGERPAEDAYDPAAEERYLIKPVWALRGEFGTIPERENAPDYAEESAGQIALIDARTGEIIERSRVEAWP